METSENPDTSKTSTATSTTNTTATNPQWEKAREALAKISVDTTTENSGKATYKTESYNAANSQMQPGQQAAYQQYYQHCYQQFYPPGGYQTSPYQQPYGFMPGYPPPIFPPQMGHRMVCMKCYSVFS